VNRTEKLAIDLRQRLGIPDDKHIDTLDLLRRLKIAGIINEFGPGIRNHYDDVAAQWTPDDRSIRIENALWFNPAFADDLEMRFTVAHELGHVVNGHEVRNRKIGGKIQFGAVREQDEIAADDFALAFLIPLTFAFTAPIFDADDLSKQFGISKKAAERRMVDLQRYARLEAMRRQNADDEDNYADAMAEMRKNALAWNAPISRSIATEDEDWNF